MANSKKALSPEYEAFVEEMLEIDSPIITGAMFSMPCVKAFAGSFNGGVVVKLGEPEHAQALNLKGAELFDPSGSGRVMKEWVVIPPAYKSEWVTFGAAGMRYAS